MNLRMGLGIGILVIGIGSVAGIFQQASAARFESSNYKIDASVGNSFGGSGSSTNYKLVSSGGESIIGEGTGGSYKLGTGYVAQLQQSLQLAVQPNDLLAYYPLDEAAGTRAYDNSADTYDMEFSGTPTWTAGKLGGGISATTSNYLTLPAATPIDTATITVEAWLNMSSASASAAAVAKFTGTGSNDGGWVLGQNGFGGWRMLVRIGSTNYSAQAAATMSTWQHVVGTYDGTNVKIYVDGDLIQSTPAAGSLASDATQTTIGARTGGNFAWPGAIDHVKIFGRALSDAEVEAEYDAQDAGNHAGTSLGTIISGTSQTASLDAIVLTDSPGYSLTANQNQNLTSGGNSIPAVSGSIASPLTWTEGTTKGLGFTLYGSNAGALPGKWSSGNAYAAFPGTGTGFYDRSSFSGGTKDILNIRLRADVVAAQVAGDYTNTVTWTGVMTP